MNKNNLVAALIAITLYAGPFGFLFFRNNGSEIVDTGPEMLAGVSWILGMILAFYFAVNQPIGKAQKQKMMNTALQGQKKAA